MIRALAIAAGAGAAWGAAIPGLLLRGEGTFDFLVEVGRFLVVAWALGLLARDWRAGAAVGGVFALSFAGATEVVPWYGGGLDLSAEDARFIASIFDAGTGPNELALLAAAAVGAAGALWHSSGRARSASAAVLAGALAADLVNRLPHSLHSEFETWLAAGQAAAGLVVALLATRGARRALLAALVPLAVVSSTPSLLGQVIISQPQDDIGVIR